MRLPISGQEVELGPATGYDDLVLVEHEADLAGALEVCRRRARVDGPDPLPIENLPVGDLDVVVVALRQAALGDWVVGEGACGRCGERVDVSFALSSYVDHLRPRRPASVEPDEVAGWWRLRRHDISFRLPTVADVLACAGAAGARRDLLDRCVRGEHTARSARAAERAMASLAPTLQGEVSGHCPECERDASIGFDARAFCLREMRDRAAAVLLDVVRLAATCGWSEPEILSLPSSRRAAYVDLISAPALTWAMEANVA